ncbi:MAG: winged helix-turn-helix domain-containing protein [Pseudomonadota bacterium]
MLEASSRVFLVTGKLLSSPEALERLSFALENNLRCVAVLLESMLVEKQWSTLLENCVQIDKTALSAAHYAATLQEEIGHPLKEPQQEERVNQSNGFKLGEWRVYPNVLRIESDSEAKTLEKRLFDVLNLMVRRAPDVVSLNELLDEAWPGVVVEENSVHRAISRLRKAFRDNPKSPKYIQTIPKVGYRLAQPVFWQNTEGRAAPNSSEMGTFVQLETFRAGNSVAAADLATALTDELQALLMSNRSYAVMPRTDQIQYRLRKPRFVISGALHSFADTARVSLELTDMLTDKIEWSHRLEVPSPDSLQALTSLAEQLASEVLIALRELN